MILLALTLLVAGCITPPDPAYWERLEAERRLRLIQESIQKCASPFDYMQGNRKKYSVELAIALEESSRASIEEDISDYWESAFSEPHFLEFLKDTDTNLLDLRKAIEICQNDYLQKHEYIRDGATLTPGSSYYYYSYYHGFQYSK